MNFLFGKKSVETKFHSASLPQRSLKLRPHRTRTLCGNNCTNFVFAYH